MRSFHLEIVSHCWQYTRLLTYQLSSLVLHQPMRCRVTMTVCHTPSDFRTVQSLHYFHHLMTKPNLTLNPLSLPREHLMRRAIGRNIAARASQADWVWFADCDHTFGTGCLDALAAVASGTQDVDLLYPRIVLKNRLHALGDKAIAKVVGPGLYEIDREDFEPVEHNRAIGGIQIARGSRVRQEGYCPDIYQQPEADWKQTKEDPHFRKQIGNGRGVLIPNLYRIRHSRCGRETKGIEL
jgi:hypothetical protein